VRDTKTQTVTINRWDASLYSTGDGTHPACAHVFYRLCTVEVKEIQCVILYVDIIATAELLTISQYKRHDDDE